MPPIPPSHDTAIALAPLADRICGSLWGLALGDSLGLPSEGLTPQRLKRWYPGPLRQRLLAGYGFCSDDTEHACMVGQALLHSPDDPEAFARSLGWRLRGWLLGLPAGIGLATLRSILRLWVGFPASKSGVFSAGNGPAMRSPLLGICLRDRPDDTFRAYIRASTRLTHTDPKAEQGALAVALAARWISTRSPSDAFEPLDFIALLRRDLLEPSFASILDILEDALHTGKTEDDLIRLWGLEKGITGYMYHTIPLVLFVWLRNPWDLRKALEVIIGLGGDTDTTAAIVGALVGAGIGASAIPSDLRTRLLEWPRSLSWQARLAERLSLLSSAPAPRPLPLFWPALPFRNLAFLALIVAHGFRRLFPPW